MRTDPERRLLRVLADAMMLILDEHPKFDSLRREVFDALDDAVVEGEAPYRRTSDHLLWVRQNQAAEDGLTIDILHPSCRPNPDHSPPWDCALADEITHVGYLGMFPDGIPNLDMVYLARFYHQHIPDTPLGPAEEDFGWLAIPVGPTTQPRTTDG